MKLHPKWNLFALLCIIPQKTNYVIIMVIFEKFLKYQNIKKIYEKKLFFPSCYNIQISKFSKIAFFDYMNMVSFHFGSWRPKRRIFQNWTIFHTTIISKYENFSKLHFSIVWIWYLFILAHDVQNAAFFTFGPFFTTYILYRPTS